MMVMWYTITVLISVDISLDFEMKNRKKVVYFKLHEEKNPEKTKTKIKMSPLGIELGKANCKSDSLTNVLLRHP